MSHPAERALLELLASADRSPLSRSYWRTLEDSMAELLGGVPYDRRGATRGPDILITRADDAPVAVELKVMHAHVAKNIRNRVSDLLAAAVETRRSFHQDVTLGAVLLIAHPEADTNYDMMRHLATSVRQLLRQSDGIGYDAVLVCFAGSELRWRPFVATDDADLSEGSFNELVVTQAAVEVLMRQPGSSPGSSEASAKAVPDETSIGSRQRRILLVADEWRSGRGGVSTVNRELAIALAKHGIDTAVMVPRTSESDIRAASEHDVELVVPARIPGLNERELLMLRPVFSDQTWEPDVIIGHGRVLGPYAAALQQQFFPDARRVHFVHTDAEELEAAKETPQGKPRMLLADARRGLERDLAQSADLVVGVGPLLTATIKDELIGPGPQPPVICLVPGLREGLVVDPLRLPPVKNKVLIVGRADDFQSKGIDIAAEALLGVLDRWPANKPHPPTLVVRGVPDDAESLVKERLEEIFEGRMTPLCRPYSDSEEKVALDLAQSQVVLMPSRHEGFGLTAYEAIASGVPVLIGANSGLAQFLNDSDIDTTPSSIVTTRNSATQLAVHLWGDAISRVLSDPLAARAQAAQLRTAVAAKVSWGDAVQALLAKLDTL